MKNLVLKELLAPKVLKEQKQGTEYYQLCFKGIIDMEEKEVRFNINPDVLTEQVITNINELIEKGHVIEVDEKNIESKKGMFEGVNYNFIKIKKTISTLNNNVGFLQVFPVLSPTEKINSLIKK